MENGQTGINPQTDPSVDRGCGSTRAPAAFRPVVMWVFVPSCGRGLVACADVDAGTALDVAPAIPVREGESSDILRPYVFQCHRDGCVPAYSGEVKEALVFGPMALCNHSDDPNATVCFEQHKGHGLQARLIALRSIAKGEEVTINYTDSGWYKENRLL